MVDKKSGWPNETKVLSGTKLGIHHWKWSFPTHDEEISANTRMIEKTVTKWDTSCLMCLCYQKVTAFIKGLGMFLCVKPVDDSSAAP